MIKPRFFFFYKLEKKKKALGKSCVGSWHTNRVCKWS